MNEEQIRLLMEEMKTNRQLLLGAISALAGVIVWLGIQWRASVKKIVAAKDEHLGSKDEDHRATLTVVKDMIKATHQMADVQKETNHVIERNTDLARDMKQMISSTTNILHDIHVKIVENIGK